MKKLLGILVLSLLLGNKAFSAHETTTVSGPDATINKKGGRLLVHDSRSSAERQNILDERCKEFGMDLTAQNIKLIHKGGFWQGDNHVYDFDCVGKNEITQAKKIEMESLINRAKDTCKSLGFNEGTEKFADCSLKLYSQSVELAAEQNKSVVMQPQSSGSNVMTIYDPARDSRILINKGQRMLSGACTLGIDC